MNFDPRENEAYEIFDRAMAWVVVDEALSTKEWDAIKKKFPEAKEQIWEGLDTIDKSYAMYLDDKIKLADFKKVVKNFFTMMIEIISAHRKKPATYLLRKK